MDHIQIKSNLDFAKLVLKSKNMVTTAGRYASDERKLAHVFNDIVEKLDISTHQRVFDIGSGYGLITKKIMKLAASKNLQLFLMDIPEIIAAVKKDLLKKTDSRRYHFYSGTFPHDFPFKKKTPQFDRILLYSVIHYTTQPEKLIDRAVDLLAPYGKMLIGDIPNMSRKGRFLSSKVGKAFDAKYKKIPINQAPQYKNHHHFLNENKKNPLSILNDDLVVRLIKKYRDKGYDVFVLPQSNTLPFCYTREDLLICRND